MRGISPVTGEFPTQRASNKENVSIWWSHHAYGRCKKIRRSYRNAMIPTKENSHVNIFHNLPLTDRHADSQPLVFPLVSNHHGVPVMTLVFQQCNTKVVLMFNSGSETLDEKCKKVINSSSRKGQAPDIPRSVRIIHVLSLLCGTDTSEWSWCQLCRHWPVPTKLASL